MSVLERFRKAKRDFETKQTVRQAGKLKGLREERIRQEGRAKIRAISEEQKGRIEKAKSTSAYGKFKKSVAKSKRKKLSNVANRITQNNKTSDKPYWLEEKPKKPSWL